jgi:hypothetical protein
MGRPGKEVKIGHDKRPAPQITTDQPLYNIRSGKPLTDEGGTPLVSQEDTFILTEASSAKATPVTFNTDPNTNLIKKKKIRGDSFSVNGITVTGTNSFFVSDVSGGDVIFLPTGFSEGVKFYEERFVDTVIDNATLTLRTPPSTNVNLFTLLQKKLVVRLSSNWKVEEQFPEFSDVSTTILGVPKAEEQISLFADVSSYGQDDSRFVFYRDDGGTYQPEEWVTRRSELYGDHFRSRLREEKEESAIVLEAFPTPYIFPYGPRFAVDGLYDETKYANWNNFLKLGTILYTYFSNPANNNGNEAFKNKFIPFNGTLDYTSIDFYESFTDPLNSKYLDLKNFFGQVDIWTETWRDIQLDRVTRPNGGLLDAEWINSLAIVQANLPESVFPTLTAPGYGTNYGSFIFMQSRRAFRYQPGRISGYTFGIRTSNDATDSNTITEWGIGNPTDQLVFQVVGSQFNIVRRSIVPLSDSILAQNSLNPEDQKEIVVRNPQRSDNPEEEEMIQYETVISSDFWNGDPLDGTGNSRYAAILNRVTMYKIEFGWYGAIGIQFYAFIPVENNEARWVKLHRLVIENQLDQPCMGDPFYRFIFSLQIKDNISLRSPQYIYKYGTSCYIDGGDEGTVEVYSSSSDVKEVKTDKDISLIGIYPKNTILNSTGQKIINKKTIVPKQLSISADDLTEIKVVKCTGCPGHGQNYNPNLDSGENGISRIFSFQSTGGGSYSQSTINLDLLSKTVTSAVSIGATEITLNNVNNLRVGDFIDEQNYFDQETTIAEIAGNTITLNKATVAEIPASTSIEIQPLFLQTDAFAKIIRPGFWNVYLGEFSDSIGTLGYTTSILDGWSAERGDEPYDEEFKKISETSDGFRVMPDQVRISGSIVNIPKTSWQARISQYGKIAASSIPISGRLNQFLWMNTYPRESSANGSQYADFKFGVTNFQPQTNAGPNDVLADLTGWRDLTGTIINNLPQEARLETEWHSEGVGKDANGYETGETTFGRIMSFTYDYRIKNPPGTNTGRCSYANVTVLDPQSISVQQLLGETLNLTQEQQDADPDYDATATYLRTPPGAGSFNFGFNPVGGEVAYNPVQQDKVPDTGTGKYFTTDTKSYTDTSGASPVDYQYVKISGPIITQTTDIIDTVIWFTSVEIRSFRKLAKKAFNFKPFPLYFYVDTRDNSRLNSVVITEQTEFKNTYNPKWYTSDDISVDAGSVEVGPIGNTTITTGDLTLPPANYDEKERLSSASVDIQNTNQLRPYTVIDTFYVSNQTKTVDLTNIFDFEKELITPDLLNTEAVFFIGRSKSGSDTNVQATVTFVEQQ